MSVKTGLQFRNFINNLNNIKWQYSFTIEFKRDNS